MGTPALHLPPAISASAIQQLLSEIGLPEAAAIEPLNVTAAFHSIYLLQFTESESSSKLPSSSTTGSHSRTLVLRVSGNHIPRIKTLNEVAVLKWIKANCPTIPVPEVVSYSADDSNTLGREFTILECVPGTSVDKIYPDLTEGKKLKLVSQLTDIILELNKHQWNHVGGLTISSAGDIVPGPALEDTFWLVPDIQEHWGSTETVDTLNPTGTYPSHAAYVTTYLKLFIYSIDRHPSLSLLQQDFKPRLQALVALIPKITALDKTELVLAHKDLHFANIMAISDGTITGILDWEFAGVVPALRWDPVRAFLWNGQDSQVANDEKYRLQQIFEDELTKRGEKLWWKDTDPQVDSIWTVIRYVRAIVEVCPRGQKLEAAKGWRDAAAEALLALGV
ncbi:hypothetical protein VHEMI06641 [[Torrubiella] hemipterigena]|uniref:Aminoglycoside phosphotransferase domain-containing protein n=1 Tax=[Torrubiella] hemipterigena TaxID=1531966 RepID=A0A0A1T7V6_9HYPO|nr:hypothetical protein VHEMI06641 [[Torrubiella] hemipterigena]